MIWQCSLNSETVILKCFKYINNFQIFICNILYVVKLKYKWKTTAENEGSDEVFKEFDFNSFFYQKKPQRYVSRRILNFEKVL